MELIKPGMKIDFIGKRRFAYIFSIVLVAISVGSLILHGGPNYGIDFAGGSLVQVKFDKNVDIQEIKDVLTE
ncbi:MAG: protein translocase subunit SecF, partial [Deltaproteobacteria bacterium]